jgi:colicin import membrane protein
MKKLTIAKKLFAAKGNEELAEVYVCSDEQGYTTEGAAVRHARDNAPGVNYLGAVKKSELKALFDKAEAEKAAAEKAEAEKAAAEKAAAEKAEAEKAAAEKAAAEKAEAEKAAAEKAEAERSKKK